MADRSVAGTYIESHLSVYDAFNGRHKLVHPKYINSFRYCFIIHSIYYPPLFMCAKVREMRARPQTRKMQFVRFRRQKKEPETKSTNEKHKNVLFHWRRESWLSTDRSTAIFAHTLFCPIPSNLNSILETLECERHGLHFFQLWPRALQNRNVHHELWVISTTTAQFRHIGAC